MNSTHNKRTQRTNGTLRPLESTKRKTKSEKKEANIRAMYQQARSALERARVYRSEARAVSRSWPPTRPAGRKSYTPEPLCASSCAQGFGNSDAPDCPGSAAAEKSTSKPELGPGAGSAAAENARQNRSWGRVSGAPRLKKSRRKKR